MAKKRRKPMVDGVSPDSVSDALGETMDQYHVNLAGVFVVSGTLGAIGLGVTAFALTRQSVSVAFLLIGGFLLLAPMLLLAFSLLNVGRRLEVRKHGIRFVEAGVVTEMLWEEITDIQVNRNDDTYMGVVSVQKRSSDSVSPSGPLTKTDWDITIHAQDRRTIRLSPTFLKLVPNVQKLISRLRMRAGL